MLVDKRTEFCDNVTLPTAIATALIGAQIDISDVRDVGHGEPIYAVFIVSAAATSGGSATVAFKIVSDATAAISTTTSTIHATIGPFDVADMILGAILGVVVLPDEGNAYEQFLGILEVVATATLTAGAIDIFLTRHPSGFKVYPDGDK